MCSSRCSIFGSVYWSNRWALFSIIYTDRNHLATGSCKIMFPINYLVHSENVNLRLIVYKYHLVLCPQSGAWLLIINPRLPYNIYCILHLISILYIWGRLHYNLACMIIHSQVTNSTALYCIWKEKEWQVAIGNISAITTVYQIYTWLLPGYKGE